MKNSNNSQSIWIRNACENHTPWWLATNAKRWKRIHIHIFICISRLLQESLNWHERLTHTRKHTYKHKCNGTQCLLLWCAMLKTHSYNTNTNTMWCEEKAKRKLNTQFHVTFNSKWYSISTGRWYVVKLPESALFNLSHLANAIPSQYPWIIKHRAHCSTSLNLSCLM